MNWLQAISHETMIIEVTLDDAEGLPAGERREAKRGVMESECGGLPVDSA
jgi:hypothetical protein